MCVIDIFSKYAWVVHLKDKKGYTIIGGFPKILDESGRKLNKIWVDEGTEFYNKWLKSWLEKNDIEMYASIMRENVQLPKDLLEP